MASFEIQSLATNVSLSKPIGICVELTDQDKLIHNRLLKSE